MIATRECRRIEWWRYIRDAELPFQAKLVAYALSTWMDPDGGRCYPGQEAIALACGWKWDNPVRDWTRWLEEHHLLRIVRHGGVRRNGRAQATHLYVPLLPVDNPVQPGQPSGLDDVDEHDQPGRNDDQPGRNDDQPGQPSGRPSQSLPLQSEPHHVNGGSLNGSQPDQEPDPYVTFTEAAYKLLGTSRWQALLSEDEAHKVKFRGAVKEQLAAGADPRRLAKSMCERDPGQPASLASLLAWRAREAGAELTGQGGAS